MATPKGLSWAASLAGMLLGALTLAGCDNPTCVFGGTCFDEGAGGGAGGLGSAGATFPREGDVLNEAAPTFVGAVPGGQENAHPETPIFLEYSESLSAQGLNGAFGILDVGTGQPIPAQALLSGDRQVVVLVPLTALPDQRQYQVFYNEGAELFDLNGQAVDIEPMEVLSDFVVDEAAVGGPRFIYAFPSDGSTGVGDTSQIVVGFDRQMDEASITSSSFEILVDGIAPTLDPDPEVLIPALGGGGAGIPASTQVWSWTPEDLNGRRVSYGADVDVTIALSQGGGTIQSLAGDDLPISESAFTTLAASVPTEVAKAAISPPADAFGRASVLGTDALVTVTLADPAPASLFAEVFMTGTSPSNAELLRSLARTVSVPAGVTSFDLTAPDLEFFDSSGDVQFADGDFSLAVQLRIGTARGGVRLFDADLVTGAQENPVFDTTPPTLLGLSTDGAVTELFISDVRDLTIIGQADEEVAFAFVDAGTDGTNGGSLAAPPAAAFSGAAETDGEFLFTALPVPVGAVDSRGPRIDYEVTVFDRAMNPSATQAIGTFIQRGVVGPGVAPLGQQVVVRVFDATNLKEIVGASVFSHQENGGAVVFVDSSTTGSNGAAQVMGAAVGDTLISVDLPGYDLFTFHGVPRDTIDVLLEPTNALAATVEGEVINPFSASAGLVGDNVVADSRAPRDQRLSLGISCSPSTDTGDVRCSFGPLVVAPGRVGLQTFLATNQDILAGGAGFSSIAYLASFGISGPLAGVNVGGDAMGLEISGGEPLLVQGGTNIPVQVPTHVLDTSGLSNLGAVTLDPLVTVETTAVGMPGPLVVGRGVADSTGATTWNVFSAIPGTVSPVGALGSGGAIDASLFLRASLTDAAGNESVARPRVLTSLSMLDPMDVPRLLSPSPGAMTGGDAYSIIVEDTIPDALGGDGIVEVVVEGPSGRKWRLWRLDTSDAAGNWLLSVPDLASQGGSALPDGSQSVEVRAWHYDFDRGQFLWSDIPREHERMGRAAAVTYTQD